MKFGSRGGLLARMAAQGRWLVPDPAGLAAVDITNPQTWNRYAYVGNNPLTYVDLEGLSRCAGFMKGYGDCDPVATGYNTGLFGGIGSLSVLTTAYQGTQVGIVNSDGVLTGIGYIYPNMGMTSLLGSGLGGGGGYLQNLSSFRLNSASSPSKALLNFLLSCEGFSSTAYADKNGNCTIGYGHLLNLGPCTAADNALSVTQSTAMSQFSADVNSAATMLTNNLSVPLNQGQFDAMVSLAFNMGPRLKKHDVWRDASSGNMAAVPGDIMSLGAGGPGMPPRRANEANMFANGLYTSVCYSVP